MTDRTRLLDLAMVGSVLVLAGVPFVLFGVFLWHGALGLVDLGLSIPAALLFDALLSLTFFAQHSGMIRPAFRERLAARLPRRYVGMVYAMLSGIVLGAVAVLWQPADPTLFSLSGAGRLAMRGLFLLLMAGFARIFIALRGFDPFGVTSIAEHWRGRRTSDEGLVIRGPYRLVRHPMYALTICVLWVHPDMSADRLLLAVLWSAWIVVGARLEERDLVAAHGAAYVAYQRSVPMLCPRRLHSGSEM